MMRTLMIVAAGLAAFGTSAAAEIVDAQPNGFEVRQSVEIAAPAAKVFDALVHVGSWWNGRHSYSQDARNLTIEARAGGCFCEALPGGGSVRHMEVVYFEPGKAIRLSGALGPLQSMGASGHLAWVVTEKDGKTRLVQTYDVGGYAKGGLDKMAAPVDEVLGEQIARLKAYVETGKPD